MAKKKVEGYVGPSREEVLTAIASETTGVTQKKVEKELCKLEASRN